MTSRSRQSLKVVWARRWAGEAAERESAGENVNNGWNRAVKGVRHAWAPDPSQPLPQWVQLDLPEPAVIDCLHVSLQRAPDRATDFRIDVWRDSDWCPAAMVTANDARRRVVHFDPVTTDKVRFAVLAAPAQLAVCEIRLYRS